MNNEYGNPSPQKELVSRMQPQKLEFESYDAREQHSLLDAEAPVVSYENFDRIEKMEVNKVFKDIIYLQRDLETAKIELALLQDFNLFDAFSMIDDTN